jgi:hypothetical protein
MDGIKMKKNFSMQKEENEKQKDRKHCRLCTFYIDGHQEVYDGTNMLVFFPIPGMQHHRKLSGNISDRIGFTAPCSCGVGEMVVVGYKKNNS